MTKEIPVGEVKTITQIVARIRQIEGWKIEYSRTKDYDSLRRIQREANALYWVLGVRTE